MNLLADESVHGAIVRALRADGHNVQFVAEMSSGIDDEAVLQLANTTQSLLITEDKDFGDLVYRLQRVTLGVILVRLDGFSSSAKALSVADAFRKHAQEFVGAFSVISPGILRIRRQDASH